MPPAACTSGSDERRRARSRARRPCARTRANCSSVVGSGTTTCSGSTRRTACACRLPDRRRTSRRTCRRDSRAEAQEARAAQLAAVEPILQGHLHRDFDSHRAGLGEKHVLEISGQQRRESRCQDRGRRVHEPAEHHVRHSRELRGDGGANVRVVVAVAGGPPGRVPSMSLRPSSDTAARRRCARRAAAPARSSSAGTAATAELRVSHSTAKLAS